MSAHSYDLDAMQEFITLLDQQITTIAEHNTSVERTAAGVLQHFTGSAAAAYATRHTSWQADATELLAEIRAIRDQAATARTNYLEAEQANREMRS
ncbi:WXG100 family type VII secretion target [Nocardia sp. NPDC127579]|uniref:WXG100 family type VII secretion target n=1 Tax=Nocardia sp. NPDC127579 TaxID=3345402 RepID=UPI003645E41D